MAQAVTVRAQTGTPGPGLAFAGFAAGVAVQLGQPGLSAGALYAALVALALAWMGLLFPGGRCGAGGFFGGDLAGIWPDGLARQRV